MSRNQEKHTPGPWTIQGEYVEALDLDRPRSVCTMAEGRQSPANARLIAAAPDLLKACQQVMLDHRVSGDMDEECYVEPYVIGLCRQALLKAEGK